MESADGAILSLVDEHRAQLNSLYQAGSEAHSGLSLPFEEFSRRLICSARDAKKGVVARLADVRAADYFLASACECGCAGAWERLSYQYLPRLRGIALRWGASPAEAEEVVQDLPGELLGRPSHGRTATLLGSYNGTGSLLAWLGTLVERGLSRRSQKRASQSGIQPGARPAVGASHPPESVVHSETGERVGAAFDRALVDLSTREFLLVTAKFRDGRSQREIAEQLGISEPRVSYLMKRALDRLRRSVLREVLDETAAHWLDRDGLATVLEDVVARVLDRRPPA